MSAAKHTPTPWIRGEPETADGFATIRTADGETVIAETYFVEGCGTREEAEADFALMLAAPDHALLLAAMAKGAARWEPFNLNARYPETDPGGGELVVNGMRYTTRLDELGCPALNDTLRAVLGRVAQ